MPCFRTPGHTTSITANPVGDESSVLISIIDKTGNTMSASINEQELGRLTEYLMNTFLGNSTEPMSDMTGMPDEERIALADKLHDAIEEAIWDDPMKAEPYEPLEDHCGDSDHIGKKHQPRPQPEITHLSTCVDGRSIYTTVALSDDRILSTSNVKGYWFELPPIPSK